MVVNSKGKEPRIVIVGGGYSLRGSNLGPQIDGFDEVIRINHLPHPDFIDDVGKKITVLALAKYAANPTTLPRTATRLFIYPAGTRNNKAWEPTITRKADPVETPSTGLTVAAHFIGMGIRVHLAGLDCYCPGRPKNYWSEEHERNYSTHHSRDQERELIAYWVSEKMAEIIRGNDED